MRAYDLESVMEDGQQGYATVLFEMGALVVSIALFIIVI